MRPGLGAFILLVAGSIAACTSAGTRAEAEPDIVEVFGPYRDREADRFADVLENFEDITGIEVRYIGSVDFVADLLLRTGEGNDPPDIAVVPQVGVVRQLVDDGDLVELATDVQDTVMREYSAEGAALGTVDGTLYSVPWRLSVKSLVWYRPSVFEANGWKVPGTLGELEALVRRIADDGQLAPWCLGIEAGSATGWVATDWVEDLILRRVGADGYREWVTGQLAFADAEIEAVFTQFRALALSPGRSLGGVTGVVETPARTAVLPLFEPTQSCAMHRQADFVTAWFPDDTSIGVDGDVDFFVLPGDQPGPTPILVAGDQLVQFDLDPEVDQLMAYLATPQAAGIWARQGGFISPNAGVAEEVYPEEYLAALADALERAPALAFDGSDQMPPEVGTGLFWTGITDWILGSKDYPTLAAELDEALSGEDEG